MKVLELLGLDGAGVTNVEKREIIQAIYDKKCDTDKSLTMMVNCEPIRRIVQTLALNLLETMKPETNDQRKAVAGIKDGTITPVITYEKDETDNTMKLCIKFPPGTLKELSGEMVAENKAKNSNKEKNATKGDKKPDTTLVRALETLALTPQTPDDLRPEAIRRAFEQQLALPNKNSSELENARDTLLSASDSQRNQHRFVHNYFFYYSYTQFY